MQNFYIRVSGWKGSRDVRHRYGHCWAEPAASDARGPVECKTFTSARPAETAPAMSGSKWRARASRMQNFYIRVSGWKGSRDVRQPVRPLLGRTGSSDARGPIECKTFTSVRPAERAPARLIRLCCRLEK